MPDTIPPEIHQRVEEILTTAIGELGGPTRLVERQEQELLPALAESAYVLVLHDEAHKTPEQIAAYLGISTGAVSSVFEAPYEAHLQRVQYREDNRAEFDRHQDPAWSDQPMTGRLEPEFLAGAVAKFAYGVVKRKHGFPV